MSDEEIKIKEYVTMLMYASPFSVDIPRGEGSNVVYITENSVSTSTAEFHLSTTLGFGKDSVNLSYYSIWQEIIRNHRGEVSPKSAMSVIKAEIAEMAKKIEQKK